MPARLRSVAVTAGAFVLAGGVGALASAVLADDDSEPAPKIARVGHAVRGSKAIQARAPDPYGVPPDALGLPRRQVSVKAPPWAVLTWKDRSGASCYEAGQVINPRAVNRGNAIPGVPFDPKEIRPGLLVGSLRPDAKFGSGIQFYGQGRFLPHPHREGGSCGWPSRGAGLIFGRESFFERRDLGPDRTIVAGIAGPRVTAVTVDGPGPPRPLRLSRRRAFVASYRGILEPPELVVRVRYRDGSVRRFDGSR